MTNYELGVVFPVFSSEEVKATVVWDRPAKRYAPSEGDEPWFREESALVQKAEEVQRMMAV